MAVGVLTDIILDFPPQSPGFYLFENINECPTGISQRIFTLDRHGTRINPPVDHALLFKLFKPQRKYL